MSTALYLELFGFTRREIQLVESGLCDVDEVACAKECREPSPFLQWLKEARA